MALSEYPGVPGSEYINANFIKGASGSNAYIACQGPLPHTVNDFWRMVVECEVQVIVMACNEQEAGKHKCEKYWRDENDELTSVGSANTSNQHTATFGKYEVTLLKSREICPDFLVRTMRLRWKNEGAHSNNDKAKSKRSANMNNNDHLPMSSQSNSQGEILRSDLDEASEEHQSSEESSSSDEFDEERTVCQFHYSAWPDHGIPLHVKPLLEMVRLIRDCQASETLPVLIHCSAGCGRTGTICAIDFIWGLLRTGKLSEDFSLYSLVREMRKQRIAMVQTVDQYILVHRAVKELFLEQLKVIDAHPYENVDDEGHPISMLSNLHDFNEPIVPDYETIFIKGNEQNIASSASSTTSNSNLNTAVDFDRILGQKMIQSQLQQRTQQTAYNAKEIGKSDKVCLVSEEVPPNPPPKQRDILDSKPIDSRTLLLPDEIPPPEESAVFPAQELVLFEPPASKKTPENIHNSSTLNAGSAPGPQKFKKGNLRLTQTEDGAWKLQELESEINEYGTKASSSQSNPLDNQTKKEIKKNEAFISNKKGKNRKDKKSSPNRTVDDGDSPKAGELLRRPSIKKIRAFFNKDKQQLLPEMTQPTSASSSSSASSTCLDQINNPSEGVNDIPNENGDHDIAMAISKLPKLEEKRHLVPDQLVGDPVKAMNSLPNSKSVPSSLDRKMCNTVSVTRSSLDEKQVLVDNTIADTITQRSQISDRTSSGYEFAAIPSKSSTYNSFSNTYNNISNNDRPSLPVKRSKSMRAGSMSPPSTSLIPVATTPGTKTSTNHTSVNASMRSPVYNIQNKPQDTNRNPWNNYEDNINLNEHPQAKFSDPYCDNLSSNSASTQYNKHYFGMPLEEKDKGRIVKESDYLAGARTEIIKTVPSPPPKPKRWTNNSNNLDYANIAMSSIICDNMAADTVTFKTSSHGPSKNYTMTDFNQLTQKLVTSNVSHSTDTGNPIFLESNLMKLQAKNEMSNETIGPEDSMRTLKDCQDYLMASFDMAEKESERLKLASPDDISDTKKSAMGLTSPARTSIAGFARANRSAESSPIATMQKKSILQQREQLFSSHSSPSSSYNKYNAIGSSSNTVTTDKSPPLGMVKLGNNSIHIGRKNHLSLNAFETTNTRNLSKKSGMSTPKENLSKGEVCSNPYQNINISTSAISSENAYSEAAMEAQRKVSAAVVTGGPKTRERRNSFREAMECGGNTEAKTEATEGHHRVPKKPYESIWFGKGGEERLNDELQHGIKSDDLHIQKNLSCEQKPNLSSHPVDSTTRPPIYANTVLSTTKLLAKNHKHYDNISHTSPLSKSKESNAVLTSLGGYEPVTFKDGKAVQTEYGKEEKGIRLNSKHISHGGLESVTLVSEIMNSNRSAILTKPDDSNTSNLFSTARDRDHYQNPNDAYLNKAVLRKQNSNGSIVSTGSGNSGIVNKGPPPPYKQPPRVNVSASSTSQYVPAPPLAVRNNQHIVSQVQSPPYQNIPLASQSSTQDYNHSQMNQNAQITTSSASKNGAYANISFIGKNEGKNMFRNLQIFVIDLSYSALTFFALFNFLLLIKYTSHR